MRQVQVLDSGWAKLIRRYTAGGVVDTSKVAFGGPKMDQILHPPGGSGKEAGGAKADYSAFELEGRAVSRSLVILRKEKESKRE